MHNYESFQHVFLIAMPQLRDPCFNQAVVYLWEYNAEGAKGVIINKPVRASLGDLLRHLQIPVADERVEKYPMLLGGPVASEQGFLVQRKRELDWESGKSELQITVTSSRDDLLPLAEGEALGDTLVALGYASWMPGQLDLELKNNDWLVAPFNETTLFSALSDDISFETSSAIAWHGAVAKLGIDPHSLFLEAGHA